MRPPGAAAWLVRRLAGAEDAPFVLADLSSEFQQIVERRGRRSAVRWYWRQALTSVVPLGGASLLRALALFRLHLRDSLRVFRRAPALSSAVVLMMALGIGANTAVFSVADAVLLRPLPYGEADALVALWERTPESTRASVSMANLRDYAALDDVFLGLAAHAPTRLVVGSGESATEVQAHRVSANFWDVLGVAATAGRLFNGADAEYGAPPTVVASHAYAEQRLGGVARAVGTALEIDGTRRVVVGVLPAAFRPLTRGAAVDLFVPAPPLSPLASRGDRDVRVVGRLRPGVTLTAAQASLDRVSSVLAREYPETNARVSAVVAGLADDLTGASRRALLLLLAVAGLVVLIACVNVANLLLVRATAQARDVAVRITLGARRIDILGAAVVGGLVFGVAGAACGIVAGVWVRDGLLALAPASVVPDVGPIGLNGRVLGAAIALAMTTGVLSSLLPAVHVTRRRLTSTVAEGAVSVAGARSLVRWRGTMLAAQVAAAVVLALGAGLLVQSLARVHLTDIGFDTDRVVAMRVRLPSLRYPDAEARLRFFETLHERLHAVPGVEAVAFANQFPLLGGWGGRILVERTSGSVEGQADLQAVSSDYFGVLGIPLRRGRLFTDADRSITAGAIVVSQAFADTFLPDDDPIGRVVRRSASHPPLTIVGVVGDVRRDGKFAAVTPQVYFAAAQTSLYAADLSAVAIKAAGDSVPVVPSIRRAVAAIDPALVVTAIAPLDEVVQASIATLRFHAWLFSAIGGLALVLAVLGVYGVATYVIQQRTREMGVRIALGASRAQVIRVMVGAGLRWTVAGVVVGVLAAAAGTRVLASLLFDTAPFDAVTFITVAAGVFTLAIVAAWMPARRALDRNPISALRSS